MGDFQKEGSMSEWNEGNLKSLRLHEAQEMINYGKINPLKRSNDGQGWNYQLWISGIDILYGEGHAKYAESESKQIEEIKELISIFLRFRNPHTFYQQNYLNRSQSSFSLNEGNWIKLKKIVELYEQKVKFYNDKHGLSTRNRTTEGLF